MDIADPAALDSVSTDSAHQPRPRLQSIDVVAIVSGFLLPIAFTPTVYGAFWTPKAAAILAFGAPGVGFLVLRAFRGDRPARAGVAFAATVVASALVAPQPRLAWTGLYNVGTGALYYLSLLGLWQIGRETRSEYARRLASAAVFAAVLVNCAIAILQTLIDLESFELARQFGGRADALTGNPVHLGALTAGGLAYALHRWVSSGNGVFLFGAMGVTAALQLSGSRFALGVAVLLLIWAVVKTKQASGRALVGAAVIGGVAIGSVVGAVGSTPSGTNRVAGAASSGVTPRIEMWEAAARAVIRRPALGYGPGQFRAATSQFRSRTFALAESPEALFVDAHNVLVEITTTVGVLGVAAFAIWAIACWRRARGAPALFMFAVIGLLLVQPVGVSTTPVALLMLGLAMPTSAPLSAGRWKLLPVSAAAAGVIAGGCLLLGDYFRLEALLDFKLDDARRSDALLPPWSEGAEMIGRIYLYESVIRQPDDQRLLETAVGWRSEAVRRDATDPGAWSELGELQYKVPDLVAAKSSFRNALRWNPVSSRAHLGLAEVAMAEEDYGSAVSNYEKALRLEPNANNRRFLEQRLARARSQLP